jgi:acyl-CoA synthetase (AMP-forming)/AMP-acid ligase II
LNICTLLEMVESAIPERVLIDSGPERHSAAAIATRAGAGASAIRASEVDTVIHIGANDPVFATTLFASAWAGVPFVPLNYRLPADQLEALVARHPRSLVLVDDSHGDELAFPVTTKSEWLARMKAAPRAERWDDDPEATAVILYTSGTTAEPKAVVLRQRHLIAYILDATEYLSSSDDEATLVAVPPYHIAGVANLLTNLYAGRRIVYLAAFGPVEWLEAVRTYRVSQAMLVPTMLARIVEHLDTSNEAPPETLKFLAYGGAKTPPALVKRAVETFPRVAFANAYGLTETSSTIAILGPEDHDAARSGDPRALERLESVGRALPSVEVRISDESGQGLAAGERGEIWVRGPQVSGEYVASSALDEDGWFRTRDIGHLDEDGYLFVLGRNDDTIIRGGENIAPAEVEAVLLTHPSVAAAVVVGVPNDEWGEEIAAAVVLNDPGFDPDDLRAWARMRLRASRAPSIVVALDELPYSETGKLLRRPVKELLAGLHR